MHNEKYVTFRVHLLCSFTNIQEKMILLKWQVEEEMIEEPTDRKMQAD